jgi:CRISPR/Cas system CMR-associated protein Cmr5 small subunit
MASNNSKPRIPVRVQLLDVKSARHNAAHYASLGRSAAYISRRTGLTKGEAYYACRLGKIRITDYRNGLNETSKIVERLTWDEVESALYKYLEKTL